MCGISGIINLSSSAKRIEKSDIDGLNRAIYAQKHRGPDDTGICAFDFASQSSYFNQKDIIGVGLKSGISGILGFNRLSIKDLSLAGHQPMSSPDGKVILVFNGEIYNDKRLRDSLSIQGYHFISTTDTEVILALYLKYGFTKTIEMLNGMFAIVLVDLRSGLIWMARDRYGIKPLYYSIYNNRIGFASEMKCLLFYNDFIPQIDMEAFYARLMFSRPSDKVLLKDVRIIDPGEIIQIEYGGIESHTTYYSLDRYERRNEMELCFEDALMNVCDVISDAVSRQMVSDVKVGCQLSGGIDSTIVSYFANSLKTDNLNDAVSIIDEKGVIGEEKYIDYVGSKLSINLHKFTLDEHYFLDNYERMIWHNDAPVYQPFFACFLKLAESAKEYVTVLLSGEGADEIAGGYSRFSSGVFQPFFSQNLSESSRYKRYSSYAEYAVMTDQTNTSFISDVSISKKLIEEQIALFDSFKGSNLTKQLKYEIFARLPESLIRQDKMTMASSIENRVPLLDNEVVDFVMTLPETYLLRFLSPSPLSLTPNPLQWIQGKYIFKEIVSRFFGNSFAYRTKQIMALDKRSMITAKEFTSYFYDKIFSSMRKRGYIDSELVKEMFRRSNEIDDLQFTAMWRAIGLETWCQLFLDKDYNRFD